MEKFEQEKEREIYYAKIDFFTNVAHEIRTPLTLINGPLENILLKKTVDSETREDLNIMKQGQDLYDITSRVLLGLRDVLKKELPDKNIWAYSGYLYEDFLPGGKVYCEASEPFLSMIDVMVDGPFILEKKDISLNFRGSSNQRIIDVPETRKNQEIVLLME